MNKILSYFAFTTALLLIGFQIYKYISKGISVFFKFTKDESIFGNFGYFLGANVFMILGIIIIAISYKKLFLKK